MDVKIIFSIYYRNSLIQIISVYKNMIYITILYQKAFVMALVHITIKILKCVFCNSCNTVCINNRIAVGFSVKMILLLLFCEVCRQDWEICVRTYPGTKECHKMLHILVVAGNCGLVGRESSGNLGIPSRTSSFGRQEKTLQRQQERLKMKKTFCPFPFPNFMPCVSPCTILMSKGDWVVGQI